MLPLGSSVSAADRAKLVRLVSALGRLGISVPRDVSSGSLERALDLIYTAVSVAIGVQQAAARKRARQQLTHRQFSAALPPYKGARTVKPATMTGRAEHGVFAAPAIRSREAADAVVDQQSTTGLPWLAREAR